ncbi:DUF2634 domain-containing protein [Brevibacillus laterosporus]|nr:DUF2634 domain-containing protein [Brevibacillus laterosporus]TPG89955.1 DUF2634 domain-containing protein [Brevibacillus laterosporus]
MVGGKKELNQAVEIAMITNKNEFFLDGEHGFTQAVFHDKKPNEDIIREAVYEAISQEKRIERVTKVDIHFDRKERKLFITFEAVAHDGIEIKEVLTRDA